MDRRNVESRPGLHEGLTPVAAHCYAETFAERFRGSPDTPTSKEFDLRLVPEKLLEPLRWAQAKMIFVNSMSDLFMRASLTPMSG